VHTPQRYQVQGVGTNSFKCSTACVNWIHMSCYGVTCRLQDVDASISLCSQCVRGRDLGNWVFESVCVFMRDTADQKLELIKK